MVISWSIREFFHFKLSKTSLDEEDQSGLTTNLMIATSKLPPKVEMYSAMVGAAPVWSELTKANSMLAPTEDEGGTGLE